MPPASYKAYHLNKKLMHCNVIVRKGDNCKWSLKLRRNATEPMNFDKIRQNDFEFNGILTKQLQQMKLWIQIGEIKCQVHFLSLIWSIMTI